MIFKLMCLFQFYIFNRTAEIFFLKKKDYAERIVPRNKIFLENFKRNVKIAPNKIKNIPHRNLISYNSISDKKQKLVGQYIYLEEFILREILDTASVSCENARHILKKKSLDIPEFKIELLIDRENKCLKIKDNGIGLTLQGLKTPFLIIPESKKKTLGFSLGVKKINQKENEGNLKFDYTYVSNIIEKIEITSKSFYSSEEWKIEKDFFFKNKISLVSSLTGNSPFTEYTVFLKNENSKLLDSTYLQELIKLNQTASSTGIQFFNNSKIPEIKVMVKAQKTKNTEQILNKPIWTCSPNLVLKNEYFHVFTNFGDKWDFPLGIVHVNKVDTISINFCIFIPRNNFLKSKKKSGKNKSNGVTFHRKSEITFEFSKTLIPPWLFFLIGEVDYQESRITKNIQGPLSIGCLDEIRLQIIKKVRDLLSVIADKSPLTYVYFWKIFGHVLKIGISGEKKYIGIFAHLFLFSSTFSLINPTSISDYVKRMKKGQTFIYYLVLNNMLQDRQHPVLENMKILNLEVILIEDYFEELLLKEIESKQKNTQRKKLSFLNVGLFEFSQIYPDKKNPFKNKNSEKNFGEFKKWYQDLLKKKVLRVFITPNLSGSVANFSNTRLNNPHFFEKPAVAREIFARKSFFLPEANLSVFEINSSNHLIELLSFNSKQPKNQRITKEIGILLWEITYLNCGCELPDKASFIKRVHLITIIILILITPLKNSKIRNFISTESLIL